MTVGDTNQADHQVLEQARNVKVGQIPPAGENKFQAANMNSGGEKIPHRNFDFISHVFSHLGASVGKSHTKCRKTRERL